MADIEIFDDTWGTPPRRDLRAMRNVTPGAPPPSGVARPRICHHGFADCSWADSPAHLHVEDGVVSPCCSGCGDLAGPFDSVTGRCPACARGQASLR